MKLPSKKVIPMEKEIAQRAGLNQATVMRICHRWMQKETTNQRGRSPLSRCTSARDDRRIVCTRVMDRTTTSRTIAQQIQFVTHHSVSARTIGRHLRQSGMSTRCPLCLLHLTGN
ncbi:transposable element Tcb1 transposase [Trichonephila clavipes]|nr:transposable element Tcb1 transposase [Trichonephila clavipes]